MDSSRAPATLSPLHEASPGLYLGSHSIVWGFSKCQGWEAHLHPLSASFREKSPRICTYSIHLSHPMYIGCTPIWEAVLQQRASVQPLLFCIVSLLLCDFVLPHTWLSSPYVPGTFVKAGYHVFHFLFPPIAEMRKHLWLLKHTGNGILQRRGEPGRRNTVLPCPGNRFCFSSRAQGFFPSQGINVKPPLCLLVEGNADDWAPISLDRQGLRWVITELRRFSALTGCMYGWNCAPKFTCGSSYSKYFRLWFYLEISSWGH